ncbi:MAG: flippase-like domain-containing protein [Spirochaetes bacterium]|nr:flippase-like domain-containing protein [Spirochaetota bacterium]
MATAKRKKLWLTIIRSIITVLLLYFIFRNIDFENTFKWIQRSNILYLSTAALFIVLFHILTTSRWRLTLAACHVHISYLRLLRFHFISLFMQNFLPATIGQDLVKGFLAFKGNPKIQVAVSIFMARLFGIFSLVLIANIAFLGFGTDNPSLIKLKTYANILLLVFILILLVLFNNKFQFIVKRIMSSDKMKLGFLKKLHIVVILGKINLYKNTRFFLLLFTVSFIIQIIFILGNYFIFLSIDQSIALFYFFLFIPVIVFIALLPISLNGLGIKEGLYYYFFKSLVPSPDIIFAVILLDISLRLLFSFIGGVLLVIKGRSQT